MLQMSIQQLGYIPPPPLPQNVTGEMDLTQGFGPMDNGTAATRGYTPVPSGMPNFSNASQVTPLQLTSYTLGLFWLDPELQPCESWHAAPCH